jgi:3-deoxy-D-manno-octulosonate cytidylyltransferase
MTGAPCYRRAEVVSTATNFFDRSSGVRLSWFPVIKLPDLPVETIPMLEAIGVIPSRYRSVRFPGKALADLRGKPLIQHVHERCRRARTLTRLLVATDDERILMAVKDFGGEAILTSPDHPSGTDRLAEVARRFPASIYVNIQGDEPLVDPRDIDALVTSLRSEEDVEMATLCRLMADERDIESPHVVKVVRNAFGGALYFSRAPIPYSQSPRGARFLRHLGLYAYRRDILMAIAETPPGTLEKAENLEQLRALEMGRGIKVLDAVGDSIGVDTPEDLERVRAILEQSVH